MDLSEDYVLVFVLSGTGVRGRLTAGRIERNDDGSLSVYDHRGVLNQYISGPRLRSWTVFRHRKPLPEWTYVSPEDARLLESDIP